MPRYVHFRLQEGNIAETGADVVVLKYARSFHGADRHIAQLLTHAGVSEGSMQPENGTSSYVDTHGAIAAPQALFMGVVSLTAFDYGRIRQFAQDALRVLATQAPGTRHVAFTIHGPGYGLDEAEALLAEFEGIYDAVQHGLLPRDLERITIVERNDDRIQRLRSALDAHLRQHTYAALANASDGYLLEAPTVPATRLDTGVDRDRSEPSPDTSHADVKRHIFVAMPFSTQLEDVYYYGIEGPVHTAGFLCERIDHVSFTGGIVEWICQKIDTAAAMIALLTDSNPNVYLEVGYAWGKGTPTVLLAPNLQELAFDVRGHKCLLYDGIRDVERQLTRELSDLKARNRI
jgi:hypothetical protein